MSKTAKSWRLKSLLNLERASAAVSAAMRQVCILEAADYFDQAIRSEIAQADPRGQRRVQPIHGSNRFGGLKT